MTTSRKLTQTETKILDEAYNEYLDTAQAVQTEQDKLTAFITASRVASDVGQVNDAWAKYQEILEKHDIYACLMGYRVRIRDTHQCQNNE